MDLSLVASRKKLFEIRGRAFSASNFSKPTLKHLQQKALVAYIERKTGQKVAEPQQPLLQVPGHRNSAAGRLSDSSSRNSKKLHRPLSAGRILDSVSSSVKYTQFLPAQPSSHSRQSSSREESHTAGKSASAEDLLDELKQPEIFRARSTSNPHAFQVRKHANEFSAINNKDISSAQRIAEGDTAVCHSHTVSEPDDRRPRKIAPRGKSMEELGVSKISKPEVFSKSSEQLDQLQGSASFLAAGTHAKMFNSGQHTDNSQTDAEKHISTFSVKHVSSHEGEIYIVPHSNGSKNRDDTATPMSGHSGEADEINLEAGSKEQTSRQEVNKMSVPNQEVSFSHGITTDPNLWISTPDINETKTDDQPSSETTVVKPQITLPNSCSISEPVSAEIQEAESIHELTAKKEQDGNEKSEDGPLGNGSMHEWELLVQEVVSADQSLACSFYPIANRKTALMLMEQLLSEDTLLMEEHYKKKQEQKVVCSEEAAHSTKALIEDKPLDPSLNSGAALPNQKVCDIEIDITEKKRQLISHIEGHLTSLQKLRSTLHSEDKENGKRGDVIETLVRESCLPAELERYTQFIGDLERVISLLLCLSARLARVQNALSTVDDSTDTEEKQSLDNRHRLLCKQRDDAKDLKDNLDRRERVVSAFLSKQLTDTQLQEYRRFVQTKASLLIRQKDLDEKQRLGEEQIEALLTSIPR